ncbi:S-adenosyl-L-methionine-dependent methyltransferase [Xylaria bambusicola]|uniref:S-adenosyl-L-methionine-dependent methyltransferase n=1 Tax=Xylaria bambusicola TaxID=326684 RepID=UPI002007A1B5|nr:S-adenosyl-L-methionine-dependent methyltransferase [Xylaria bambusicola]KAI0517444.1 S-adenosyl-L-methionine-dependent methyltransferase [Xylaria bambusicola]
MAADFEKQSYWHSRFTSETAFEWLVPSTAFIPFIEPYLNPLVSDPYLNPPSSSSSHSPEHSLSKRRRILHLGSGTSDLHIRLREKGYTDVTNVDYEPLALDRGREMEEWAFGDVIMKYVVADVTAPFRLLTTQDLPIHDGLNEYEGEGFDIVLDKSTADAVACACDEAVLAMARWVRAGLRDRDGAVWISLSYSAVRFAVEDLPFEVRVIGKIATPKERGTDPDVFIWCYLLRPRVG